MAQNKQNNNKGSSDFIPESKEYIVEGAKVFADKTTEIFNLFMDKVRETADAAYQKGSEIVENVSLTAQDYLERYRDRSEIASLKKLRDEQSQQLGYMCYMEYSGRYRFRQEFLKSDEFKEMMAQLRELDKQIIKLGKKLEQES